MRYDVPVAPNWIKTEKRATILIQGMRDDSAIPPCDILPC